MKKTHLLLVVLLATLCSSCYSYKIYPKQYRKLENKQPKRSAYIENDTLKKELKILAYSELFEIVSDSTTADLKIKLYPLEKSLVCGQPLTASMLTIGQLPVYLKDQYTYRFDEKENGKVTERKLELKIAQRVWFWDMFTFDKNFEKKSGKAVLGEYQTVVK
ncbi:hypothetical protein [Flavobacterium dankookense]|uniref:Uncharacterized protein n=1 Tax=Flavobacterium dankookense TaxID=706186 RepID=A0A4R6QA14_9FLAO|nr:hypothetical protein [Flavobacterium dankookense]TDP59458.1 hypothetical protein BC748_1710 [Flavobacterium dankookense]